MENTIELRNAEIIDKPVEGATLFCLNPDGTVNRIKADGVGGGKCAKIVVDMSAMESKAAPSSLMSRMSGRSADAGVSTVADDGNEDAATTSCTCDNMTFEEAKAILLAGEKLDAFLTGCVESGPYTYVVFFSLVAAMFSGSNSKAAADASGGIQLIFTSGDSITSAIWTADGIMVQD